MNVHHGMAITLNGIFLSVFQDSQALTTYQGGGPCLRPLLPKSSRHGAPSMVPPTYPLLFLLFPTRISYCHLSLHLLSEWLPKCFHPLNLVEYTISFRLTSSDDHTAPAELYQYILK